MCELSLLTKVAKSAVSGVGLEAQFTYRATARRSIPRNSYPDANETTAAETMATVCWTLPGSAGHVGLGFCTCGRSSWSVNVLEVREWSLAARWSRLKCRRAGLGDAASDVERSEEDMTSYLNRSSNEFDRRGNLVANTDE